MRSMALALAATLILSPAAFGQAQNGTGGNGTVGSPTAPRGGGSTMTQGTPGTGAAPGVTGGNTAGTAAPGGERTRMEGPNAPGTNAPPVTAEPVSGANSFTEGQARSRIEAAGYTDVKDLRKDDQGVWRGQAMKDGKSEQVGLDFRGNIVPGSAQPR